MCGIFGFARSTPAYLSHERFLRDAFITGTLRGEHGSGLAIVRGPGAVEHAANSIPGYEFIHTPSVEDMINSKNPMLAAIGHNRFATSGKHVDDHCHPFASGNIVGVHNGTISDRILDRVTDFRHPVDSARLYAALGETDNPIEVLTHITDGAYALVWYNKALHSVFMARNTSRPMHVINTHGGVAFASESGMLSWLAGRNNMYNAGAQMSALNTLTLYEFPLDDLSGVSATPYKLTYPKSTWLPPRETYTSPNTTMVSTKSGVPETGNAPFQRLFQINYSLEQVAQRYPHLIENTATVYALGYKQYPQELPYTLDVMLFGHVQAAHGVHGFFGLAMKPSTNTYYPTVPVFFEAQMRHERKYYSALLREAGKDKQRKYPVIPALAGKFVATASGGWYVWATSKGKEPVKAEYLMLSEDTKNSALMAISCSDLSDLDKQQIEELWAAAMEDSGVIV